MAGTRPGKRDLGKAPAKRPDERKVKAPAEGPWEHKRSDPDELEEPMVNGETLRTKAVKGGYWVISLRGIQLALSSLKLIIVARLLAPSEFGLLGIALLMMMIMETFSQPGFQQALIQRRKEIRSHLDTAWTIMILRGLVILGLLYLIAPYAAAFFHYPTAGPVIWAIGFVTLFQSFSNIGAVYFQRDLDFKRYFTYNFAGVVVDFSVAVSLAIILQSVWALIFGLIAGAAARTIVSYVIHPYRPRLAFDREKAGELWGFGRWILGASILTFLITQGDDIFVGRLLGVTALGFYVLAYKFSNMPTTEVTHVISQVTFPTYSRLQDNVPRLRSAYLRVVGLTTFVSFLAGGLIIALGYEFTDLILGEKWLPMVPALMMLAVWGLNRSIGACTGPLFQAVGRPDLSAKMMAVRLVILIALIYPLTTWWGIFGTATAVVVSGLVTRPVTDHLVLRIIDCRTRDYLRVVTMPVTGLLVMIAIIVPLKMVVGDVCYILLALLAVIGIASYLAVAKGFDRLLGTDTMGSLRDILGHSPVRRR